MGVLCLMSLALFLVGCGEAARPATPSEQQALQQLAGAPPQLHPGEKIRVTVYGEPSLSGEYQIDPGGSVSLPLAGTVKAAGLTQQQLEEQLKKHFSSGYLKDPKITVGVAEFRPFYIVGEVERPGAYPYTGGLNVLSAVAIAGGTTYRASRTEVLIQHLGENEMRAYNLSTPIPILPGDIIQIPRRYF
jgi:protein involved in polysaccharide export with SLBB domain